jgi:nucleoside diphosphate kinase (EC 2.7.4.6)
MERSFVMVKPDGVQRGLVGEIISRFEKKGLKLVAARFEALPDDRVQEQYREHLEKPFFPGLKAYITSGPVFLMVWEGKKCCPNRQASGWCNQSGRGASRYYPWRFRH